MSLIVLAWATCSLGETIAVQIHATRQQKTNWCWAACAQAAAADVGSFHTQEEIVTKRVHGANAQTMSAADLPNDPGKLSKALDALGIDYHLSYRAESSEYIRNQLKAERTVTISLKKPDKNVGHYVVIHGIADSGRLLVWDPFTDRDEWMTRREIEEKWGDWERTVHATRRVAAEPRYAEARPALDTHTTQNAIGEIRSAVQSLNSDSSPRRPTTSDVRKAVEGLRTPSTRSPTVDDLRAAIRSLKK